MSKYYVSYFKSEARPDCHSSDAKRSYPPKVGAIIIGLATNSAIRLSGDAYVSDDRDKVYFTTNIYQNLDEAIFCNSDKMDLRQLILDENMTDDDKTYISDYINANSDKFLTVKGCDDKTVHSQLKSYIDLSQKKAMCDINGLDVDFRKSKAYDLYESYANRMERQYDDFDNAENISPRESIFKLQALNQEYYMKSFSYDDVVKCITVDPSEADSVIKEIYETNAKTEGFDTDDSDNTLKLPKDILEDIHAINLSEDIQEVVSDSVRKRIPYARFFYSANSENKTDKSALLFSFVKPHTSINEIFVDSRDNNRQHNVPGYEISGTEYENSGDEIMFIS